MTRDLFKFVFFVLAVLALVLGVMRYFFVDAYAITGIGMVPTLMPGEQVFAWRNAEITQGDIVICEHPAEQGLLVVGRALAMPGDTIAVERGALVINGRRVATDMLGEHTYQNPLTDFEEDVVLIEETLLVDFTHLYIAQAGSPMSLDRTTVAEGKVYLLGDNRLQTDEDSRDFGPVSLSSCRAQLIMRNGAVSGAPGPSHGRFDILD
jgi:signal peptidase I